jgi:signal transduction histidine kinase
VVDPAAFKVQNLNTLVQEALERTGQTLVRRRIRLMKKLSSEIPSLLLDGLRVHHVLGNLLDNALESVAVGGRIRVETRKVGQHIVVEVAHDGPRGPGEALDQMFAPFAAGRPGTPAVGLGVAQQIVREHGGEVRVRSEGEWGTVVAFTVPVAGNQDRRVAMHDRRHTKNDRRGRFPVE